MTPFHKLYTAGMPIYHTGFHCVLHNTEDNRSKVESLGVAYDVQRNNGRNFLTIETPFDREVSLASALNQLRFSHLVPKASFASGGQCGCGAGIQSAVDGKCGHCRTRKERASFDNFHYQQAKAASQVEIEAIGGNVDNVYATLKQRVDGITDDIVFSETEEDRLSSLLTAIIVADGDTNRINAIIATENPMLTRASLSAALGADIEDCDAKTMQRKAIETAVSRSAQAAFSMS